MLLLHFYSDGNASHYCKKIDSIVLYAFSSGYTSLKMGGKKRPRGEVSGTRSNSKNPKRSGGASPKFRQNKPNANSNITTSSSRDNAQSHQSMDRWIANLAKKSAAEEPFSSTRSHHHQNPKEQQQMTTKAERIEKRAAKQQRRQEKRLQKQDRKVEIPATATAMVDHHNTTKGINPNNASTRMVYRESNRDQGLPLSAS